jgi:hypothetical protein
VIKNILSGHKKMNKHEILDLSKKINLNENISDIKNSLENNYEISYGGYENSELKKALEEKKPVIIKNHFLIGFDGDTFIDIDNQPVKIERMIKAVIVEDVKESVAVAPKEDVKYAKDPFFIMGRNEWPEIIGFYDILNNLMVGELYLPPHSAIVNFLNPTDDMKKKKIVSMLDGVNINVYSEDNYVDNIIHEIGHLFWRDCLNYEEKKAFENFFKVLKPSAIYQYEWERETAEEVFCTIYKWYVKSLLLNKAFLNILEFEEPRGLDLFQKVLDRIAKDRLVEDVWNLSKKDVFDYINPVFDKTMNKFMRKAGALDRIKDIELPASELNNIDRVEDGIVFIRLEKAVVPVKGNKIDWQRLEKGKKT